MRRYGKTLHFEQEVNVDTYVDASVELDIDDFIGELTDEELQDELYSRGFKPEKLYTLEKDKLKRHLCDILDVGYHLFSVPELFEMIEKKI